jgi:hypothetical protein
MTTKTSVRRLARSSRRDDTAELVQPLPPSLAAEVEGTDEADRHAAHASRYADLRARVHALAREHQAAVAADAAAERKWTESSRRRPLPKAKAPDIEAKLEEARHELALAGAAVPQSAQALAETAVPHVERVEKGLRKQIAADAQELRQMIAACLSLLERRTLRAAEASWADRLLWEPPVPPWGENRRVNPAGAVANVLREVLQALDDEEHRAVEHRRELLTVREMEWQSPGVPREIGGQNVRERREAATERVLRREDEEAKR